MGIVKYRQRQLYGHPIDLCQDGTVLLTMILDEKLIRTEACRYGVMSFFANDNTISRSLKEYGEWAQAEIEFLLCLIASGDTVLDVGAFIGTHTLPFSKNVGAEGRVYSFEPQPVFFELLKRNIRQNSLNNVRLFNTVVAASLGNMSMDEVDVEHIGNFGGTDLARLGATVIDYPSKHSIEVITIDHLGLERCALIKIDAETMELAVLEGAKRTIRTARPIVFAECNSLEHGWPVARFSHEEEYKPYIVNIPSYNKTNFNENRDNFFRDCRETSLILIPLEQHHEMLGRLTKRGYKAQLIPASDIDSLALALLKKPQYKYEVMARTEAAEILGVDFWANESEVSHFNKKSQRQQLRLLRREGEVRGLAAGQETLMKELSLLHQRHLDSASKLADSGQELTKVQDLYQGAAAELASLRELNLQTANQLLERNNELAGLKEEYQRTQAELASSRQLHIQTANQLAERDDELASLRDLHAQTVSELVERERESANLTAEQKKLDAELSTLGALHAQAVGYLVQLARRMSGETAEAHRVTEGLAAFRETDAVVPTTQFRKTNEQTPPSIAYQRATANLAELENIYNLALSAIVEKDSKLSEAKADLRRIYGSRAWKTVSYGYEIRDRIISVEARRKLRKILHQAFDMRSISVSGAFDRSWYLKQYPDVATAGINPLVHYIRRGATEGRDPNPLFDGGWYLRQNLDVAAARANPLVHYLQRGATEGRDPNPLFDSDWYLRQNSDLAAAGENPLVHYLQHGAAEGRDPNPLFDTDWYLQQNPELGDTAMNPLAHYIHFGAARGRDPSPLFDNDWYLQRYPDVAKAGTNPLVHYLQHGAAEGRDPNPLFDSDWYLQQHPDVATTGMNPLVHYLLWGANEGRDPSPYFSTLRYMQQNPDVTKTGMNPLAHYIQRNAGVRHVEAAGSRVELVRGDIETTKTAQQAAKLVLTPTPIRCQSAPVYVGRVTTRRLICVTHVLPYPSRAGNEYRIHRMLSWFATQGFEIILLICPLPGDSVAEHRLRGACSVYPNFIVCHRQGTIAYRMADGDASMKALAGVEPRDFGELLGEGNSSSSSDPRLLSLLRAFCPDLLMEILLHLDSVLQPEIVLVDYVFMTRALRLIRPDVLKIVDTIDVFSTKQQKVVCFGIEDSLALTAEEEASLLEGSDLIIAIQRDEATDLHRLAPNKLIVTAGIDFDFVDSTSSQPLNPIVLLVASDNHLNIRGLKDFLRFAWPLVKRDVPCAELRVVGSIGDQIKIADTSVKIMGLVDDLSGAYAEARVIINPAVAGTGIKVKTIEAICHLRPLVTWPAGVDGLEPEIASLCCVATNWYSFARFVTDICNSEGAPETLNAAREALRERFSADAIYKELGLALSSLCPDRGRR